MELTAEIIYWICAVLLVLLNAAAWITNLFALPGNWVMLLLTAIFAIFYPEAEQHGVSWTAVGVLAGLATLGELIEFVAGAAGAAKEGGSRRGMVLAIAGTVLGSIVGAIVGVPVPVVGPIVAAVGGGALGAFLGAYLGESWKGRSSTERMAVSKAALIGRLLGTMAKLVVGAMMVVVSAFAVAFRWL